MTVPFFAPNFDFLIQITGDRYNPTGIVTPYTDRAFELIQEAGLEFVSYGVTDTNGLKVSRQDLDGFVSYAESQSTIAIYDPEQGIAFLEPAI